MKATPEYRLRTFSLPATLIALVAALTSPVATAAEPRLVPFQARLTDGTGANLTGVYRITFVIYDEPTGGTALWSETHDTVSVVDGRLTVLLGSLSALDDPDGNGNQDDAIQFNEARFVGIKVGSETNQEMVPRHQLVPAFHARSADRAGTADVALSLGFLIQSSAIEPDSLGAGQIARNGVDSDEIALGAVGQSEIATGAVRGSELGFTWGIYNPPDEAGVTTAVRWRFCTLNMKVVNQESLHNCSVFPVGYNGVEPSSGGLTRWTLTALNAGCSMICFGKEGE